MARERGFGHTASMNQRTAHSVVLVLLLLTHAALFAFASVSLDTARDLFEASRIVQGEWLLRGPSINSQFYLGPLWFYLLAPVLWLSQSQAITLCWMGLLAAIKFPLAYQLGCLMRDRATGLWLAVALALPGFSGIGALFPTHTVMVEAAVLAQLILLWQLAQSRHRGRWLCFGLLSGLAVHAHPTTLLMAVLVPVVLTRRRSLLCLSEFFYLLAGLSLVALPLLPAMVGGIEFESTTTTTAGSVSILALPQSTWAILVGVLVTGPSLQLATIDQASWLDAGRVAFATMWLCALSGVIRVWRSDVRQVWLTALIAAVVISMLVGLARSYTPFYMTLLLNPLIAMVLILSLQHSRVRVAGQWLLGLLVVGSLATQIQVHQQARAHLNVAGIANVRDRNAQFVDADLMPALELDQLARSICASERPVVLHGLLALYVDTALDIGPQMRCPDRASAQLAGQRLDADHWLGLPPQVAKQLGLQTSTRWRHTSRHDVQILWPADALPRADASRYPHHDIINATPLPRTWQVSSAARSVLIATDVLSPYRRNEVNSVLANGEPARLFARRHVSSVWVCDHCADAAIDWTLSGSSNSPQSLDIVAIVASISP